jgi:hypothetical protein
MSSQLDLEDRSEAFLEALRAAAYAVEARYV